MRPFSWIDALAEGGPWAIVVGLVFAVIYLWRAYVKVRDVNDKQHEERNKELIQLIEKSTENTTKFGGAVDNFTQAVQNLDRRVESVEKAIKG